MLMTFFTPVRWHLFDENLRIYNRNAYYQKAGKAIFTDEQLKPIETDGLFALFKTSLFYNLAVWINHCNVCLLENENEYFSLGISVNEQDMSILTKL